MGSNPIAFNKIQKNIKNDIVAEWLRRKVANFVLLEFTGSIHVNVACLISSVVERNSDKIEVVGPIPTLSTNP